MNTFYCASTGEAYDQCQYRDDIKTDDILIIVREDVVGVAGTWPVAVSTNYGKLHTPGSTFIFRDEKEKAAYRLAAEICYNSGLDVNPIFESLLRD